MLWKKPFECMIHIVFNEPDVEVISKAIALDEGLQGELVLVRDDYAVGPLNEIYLPEGIEARKDWWRMVLRGTEAEQTVDEGKVNDPLVVHQLLQSMTDNPEEVIWIWAAQNKHDVCGYYWLMSQLQVFQGRVFILYLNNLPLSTRREIFFIPNGSAKYNRGNSSRPRSWPGPLPPVSLRWMPTNG
ncbi:MAG: hypothetical protein RLZZ42_984 [Bacteroidota bacterium]